MAVTALALAMVALAGACGGRDTSHEDAPAAEQRAPGSRMSAAASSGSASHGSTSSAAATAQSASEGEPTAEARTGPASASAPASSDATAAVAPVAPGGARADAELRREGRSPIKGYILTLPPSFASADGGYDLVIHFHGNPDVVEESFAVAGLNAAVVIVNAGAGMKGYLGRFASPRDLGGIIDKSEVILAERGLRGAHVRRVALISWSAGYGSILQIIRQPEHRARVQAIVVLDGVQGRLVSAGSVDAQGRAIEPGAVDAQEIEPIASFAREAVRGEKMLLLTHSAIPTEGEMGSTWQTITTLLEGLGLHEEERVHEVEMAPLASTLASFAERKLKSLKQLGEGHWGKLTVRGYAGDKPEHHMAHLLQMAAIALPDLRHYLESTPPPAPALAPRPAPAPSP